MAVEYDARVLHNRWQQTYKWSCIIREQNLTLLCCNGIDHVDCSRWLDRTWTVESNGTNNKKNLKLFNKMDVTLNISADGLPENSILGKRVFPKSHYNWRKICDILDTHFSINMVYLRYCWILKGKWQSMGFPCKEKNPYIYQTYGIWHC